MGFLSVLLSCSKSDDDNSSSTTGNIAAKWHLTSIVENGTAITGYTCNTNYDITEFTSVGQSITKYSDKNSSNVCTQYTDNGNYTISDNILTDVQKNGSIKIYEAKYKIKELTATTLKLEAVTVFEANSNGSNPHTENYTDGEEVKIYTKI